MRYNQILSIIQHNKPKVIVEVGCWNGLRAIMLATEALKHQKKVRYVGFDLFEDATAETDARELNVKPHCSYREVADRLKEFRDANPGFNFRLVKGDTKETLAPEIAKLKNIDLAFIDGGHSVETIERDYEALKHAKVVVLDDYYTGDKNGGSPDIERFGCNTLVAKLETNRLILPHKDPVKGGGDVAMVCIPPSAYPAKHNIVVKTKNCVPDANIHANIRYNMALCAKWLTQCRVHGGEAAIVSGGPSFKDSLVKIEEFRAAGTKIFCVKHSHNDLIAAGIVPFGCFLLDPRAHVQDFIEEPHPEVLYLTASMVHPTTMDRLIEKKARILGYHAHVGAGEDKVIGERGVHALVGGGSTAAIRGISVLHALGFRKFHLFGFDSCYPENPDPKAVDHAGNRKYYEVTVNGRTFVSDSELIAQAQDFDRLLKTEQAANLDLTCHGDGMIPHLWHTARKILPDYEDIIAATWWPQQEQKVNTAA